MMLARQWAYLSAQDVFYHPQSGNHIKVAAFNNTFGGLAVAKGAFHRFLLDGDFVAKFQDLTYFPATIERSIERDELNWLNT